jgi:hypothetical protein
MSGSKPEALDAKLSRLNKALDELNAEGVNNADPLRFDYIQNLYQRVSSSHQEVKAELLLKIHASVALYMADLANRRNQVAKTLEQIVANFPEHAEAAKLLFNQCRFRQVEQLAKSLMKQKAADANVALLRELTNSINQNLEGDEADKQSMSFDNLLYQQELSARQVIGGPRPKHVDGSGEQLVMQSMKRFRQSMKHFNIDQIIARAINQGPENPGPLNPQMLAIKSLTQMRDLSPAYLRRFAGHIETLLWLEKNSAKLINSKRPQHNSGTK